MISKGSLLYTGIEEFRNSFFIALSDSYVENGVEVVDIFLDAGRTCVAAYIFDVISEC